MRRRKQLTPHTRRMLAQHARPAWRAKASAAEIVASAVAAAATRAQHGDLASAARAKGLTCAHTRYAGAPTIAIAWARGLRAIRTRPPIIAHADAQARIAASVNWVAASPQVHCRCCWNVQHEGCLGRK